MHWWRCSWLEKLVATLHHTIHNWSRAAIDAGKAINWTRNILQEFGYLVDYPSTLFIDNQSALTVSKNPEHHGRMNHLDLRFFWLCDQVDAKVISPVYIPTTDQIADILTKALPRATVEKFRGLLGLKVWFHRVGRVASSRGGVKWIIQHLFIHLFWFIHPTLYSITSITNTLCFSL